MKRKYKVKINDKVSEREIVYIPIRYIISIILTILEVLAIIGIVALLSKYVKYFYISVFITYICVMISIIGSNDNAEYKIPWLIFVILVPIAGFMCYFIFYKRKLKNKFIKRIKDVNNSLSVDDSKILEKLKQEDPLIHSQALWLKNTSNTNIYQNTKIKYYKIGEEMFSDMLIELNKAKKFIFMEYFIIEEGTFFNSILDILKKKASEGIEVKLLYDDIGCMSKLPGNYYKLLKKHNIQCVPFSFLKGQADNEFNNRTHRKIMVIDNKVAFTGGINLADEYININSKFGHFKDCGIKLEGEAVKELCNLFLTNFYMNFKYNNEDLSIYYKNHEVQSTSYVIPFGDGPNPFYKHNVAKTAIMNMLNQASKYVYITTPYLIIDKEITNAIINASIRGVDVRIIIPHIPDKKLVFKMSQNTSRLLASHNVKIYEYEPGFIHAKNYICDDKIFIVGTINLDYRSLAHHFENGVWVYNDPEILKAKEDFLDTLNKSIYINDIKYKDNIFKKLLLSILKFFEPLL